MTTEVSFQIRPAVAQDLQGLLGLYRWLNPNDPVMTPELAAERFQAMLAQPGMTLLVATVDDTLTSTVTLSIIPNLTRGGAPYALIENVVTDAGYRKRGHGRALIRHAVDLAFKAGCYKVMLLTGRSRPEIHEFYEGCGFVQDKTGFQIRRPSTG